MVMLGSWTRSQFYEILIVTNCKSNDCREYTLYLLSLLELWDSSTRRVTDYHRVLHGDDNTGN